MGKLNREEHENHKHIGKKWLFAMVPIQHEPTKPGKILKEFYLKPRKLTIIKAAKKLKISRPNMSRLVNGYAGISALMAIKLAKAFKTTPEYWMNLQSTYELHLARKLMKKKKQ